MQVLTPHAFAHRLTTSSFSDGVTRTMRPGVDGTISVNLVDLTAQERSLARAALAEITTMTGLTFSFTSGTAKITYLNDGTGANTMTSATGTTIGSATVRISSGRVDTGDGIGSYAFRTYMHETLHALGLGHPQDYGTVRDFSQSGIANDSWQMSLMSYFDQAENTWVNATKAYNLTPMIADFIALRSMYGGPSTVHAGATTYGVGSTAGGALDHAASSGAHGTFLIVDHAGVDHVNFVGFAANQRIDLAPGAISNVMGAIGNMQIAPDTLIEDATGGASADIILGNAAPNRLAGSGGADALYGRGGNDALDGGEGNDRLFGDDGDDLLTGGAGNDSLYGGVGNDRLRVTSGANILDGGSGNDAMTGGTGNDRIIGALGSDTLLANAGNDSLLGGDGGDRLYGLDGADQLRGGAGHDILIGGAGDDWLYGDLGNDDLAAQGGTDVLNGGAGSDMLRGGAGMDRFVFVEGLDTIRGYDDAVDLIDLRGIAGLDSWAELRGHLFHAGNHVEFRMNDQIMRIEWTTIADMDSGDFLW